MMQYGQVLKFPEGKKPSTPFENIGEIYVKGTTENPTYWYLDHLGVEHQIGAGLLKNYISGYIQTKWNGVINEPVYNLQSLLVEELKMGNVQYKFNRIRLKRGLGGHSKLRAVIYNDLGELILSGTIKTLIPNAVGDFVDLVIPEVNHINCGENLRIGLITEGGNSILGWGNPVDDKNARIVFGVDVNTPPLNLNTSVDCPFSYARQYFELYYEN